MKMKILKSNLKNNLIVGFFNKWFDLEKKLSFNNLVWFGISKRYTKPIILIRFDRK